ncbi:MULTISPECIES: ATPase, T2SS/T4P/T4SS family [unclassified Paenibacillus]|uniref:ATPase, T2SS/T4P/T4SS family n=1 Tax=unclassified Paenibacillus TaxID=185978 RepID=UPI0030F83F15
MILDKKNSESLSPVPFSLKERMMKNRKTSTEDFYSYLNKMKKDITPELRREDEDYYVLNAKALMGDLQAISYFMNEIEKYVRKNPYGGKIPDAYSSITEALYHEWKGYGPAFKWITDRSYSDSTGLQIIGEQIFYNNKGMFSKYPYKMPSLDRVEQLKRTLMKGAPSAKLNKDKPSAEFKMDDPLWPGRFIRIAIWVSPRVWDGFTTITMRRQVVEYMNFDEQAGTSSIPAESIDLLRDLSYLFRNTVVAGPVGSGKSTFANTIVGEQLQGSTFCMGVVMIEKHPESILPYQIKGHRIIPIQAENDELMEVGIESLRHDPNILFMTEMRFHEWEFYFFSGEKGYNGIIGTFHTVDSEDIPYQGAFAVFTRLGGSLKGHLISAMKSCEIVFIMEPTDAGEKKLTRISEVFYDEAKNSVFASDIMRYEQATNEWTYNDQLTVSIVKRMQKKNPVVTQRFLEELKRLTKLKPMKNPLKESLKAKIVLNSQ